jgi:hypothetical protein
MDDDAVSRNPFMPVDAFLDYDSMPFSVVDPLEMLKLGSNAFRRMAKKQFDGIDKCGGRCCRFDATRALCMMTLFMASIRRVQAPMPTGAVSFCQPT